MLVHFDLGALAAEWPASVVAIGTFDGVHLGHQAVLSQAVALAAEQGLPAWVATFDQHPAAVLAPDRCPPSLATLGENLQVFERLGLAGALVLRFDQAMSQTSATDFLNRVLIAGLKAQTLVVGHDAAIGQGREGDAAWLAARIATVVVPPLELRGTRVSSRGIRELVSLGDVEAAAALLGRPYSMAGIVVRGQQLGRTLGFPTANLALSVRQALPLGGVYAGTGHTVHGSLPAAISVGARPTVGGEPTIEAFLLDYPGMSLYGTALRLEFQSRLRGQERFDDLGALARQMARDVERVAELAHAWR